MKKIWYLLNEKLEFIPSDEMNYIIWYVPEILDFYCAKHYGSVA